MGDRASSHTSPTCAGVTPWVNLTPASSDHDYGWYNSDAVNAAIDAAYPIPDTAAREKAWSAVDQLISTDGAVIPLTSQKFTYVRGSNVKG